MKSMKKLFSLLLSVIMVITVVPVMTYAAGENANVSMVVSKETVEVGDTLTVTVSYSDMKVSSLGTYIKFNKDLLECISVTGPYADMGPEYERFFFVTKANVPAMMATVTIENVSTAAEAKLWDRLALCLLVVMI